MALNIVTHGPKTQVSEDEELMAEILKDVARTHSDRTQVATAISQRRGETVACDGSPDAPTP